MPRFSRYILVLCVASFTVAAAVAWGVFEAMPHLEDEHVNYFQARVFAAGRVTNSVPPVVDAFFEPYVITLNGGQFAKYPPGYSLLLAVGMCLGQPWLVNALSAALGLLATYLLGRDLFDRQTGLLAAGLGAVSPMYVLLSGTLLSHPANLAALAFFAWCYCRARRAGEAHRHAFAWGAGALAGLALTMRPWTAFGLGLPFALLAMADLARRRGSVVPVYGRMLLSFLALGALWPVYNLVATGSPFTNTYTLIWSYDAIGFGPQFGAGHDWDAAMRNLDLDLAALRWAITGWPDVFGLPLVGLVAVLAVVLPPRRRLEPALLVPPAVLICAYLAYWARGSSVYGPRYYAEAMPFLWLVVARGLLKVGAWRVGAVAVKVALPLCVAWGILYQTGPRLLANRGLYGITRDDAGRIEAAGIHHGLVLVRSKWWTDYANLSWLNAATLEAGDNVFAEDRGEEANQAVAEHFPDRHVYYYDRYQTHSEIH